MFCLGSNLEIVTGTHIKYLLFPLFFPDQLIDKVKKMFNFWDLSWLIANLIASITFWWNCFSTKSSKSNPFPLKIKDHSLMFCERNSVCSNVRNRRMIIFHRKLQKKCISSPSFLLFHPFLISRYLRWSYGGPSWATKESIWITKRETCNPIL